MQHYQQAIVILGKEPTPGFVKTRLAQSGNISPQAASEIQTVLALHILRLLVDLDCPVILQMKGDLQGSFAQQCTDIGALVERQADGTLTDKIHMASKRAERTLILGMDMPLLNMNELHFALHSPNLVLGPAEDGGYWLIGGNQIPRDILEDIPWSTENVWKTTIAKCEELKIQYDVLSCQQDIDTISDLEQLLSNPQCPTVLRLRIQAVLGPPHHL